MLTISIFESCNVINQISLFLSLYTHDIVLQLFIELFILFISYCRNLYETMTIKPIFSLSILRLKYNARKNLKLNLEMS